MTAQHILIVSIAAALLLALIVSGKNSDRRTDNFYRSFYSTGELEQLAAGGSDLARRALEGNKR